MPRHENARHDHHPTNRAESRTLREAAAHLRRGLRADGQDAGGLGADDDFDRPEREWQTLREWAQDGGLILSPDFPPPSRIGGREHDVRFDEGELLWWKYTKAHLAGYTVEFDSQAQPYLLNALPLQYLERLLLQNEVFGDDIRLQGLWQDAAGWHIVTSQPDIAGRAATLDEIHAGMTAFGCRELPWRGIGYENSLAFQLGEIGVWDVHPANMVVTAAGLLVPIDVIMTGQIPV
ncbi:MAG: hypothetical protein ACKVY0_05865 [Prosthecobacter sp.]|uniref:hypothetical protein n=1 Tax=Prosthecobacter sp. TaxID=1965333 RepID=UPI0039025461